jgi:hypothetical protein
MNLGLNNMKKLMFALLAIPVLATAQDTCQLTSRTDTQATTVLRQVMIMEQTVSREQYGWMRCRARVQAQANNTVYTGEGSFSWADGRNTEESCSIAQQRAKDSILEQLGNLQINSRKSVVCNDGVSAEPGTPTVKTKFAVGYVGQRHEFPVYNHGRGVFSHRRHPGSTCLQITNQVGAISGTICQTNQNLWVVVDIINPYRVQ